MQVTEIRDDRQLDNLRPEWDDLVSRSRTATIFQTWEWVSTYWRHFRGHNRLSILCVRDETRLVGLAPLKATSIHGLPFRRIRLLGSRASDYLDLIVDRDSESAVLDAVFCWLRANESRWDILDMEKVPENSPTRDYWPSLGERFGWRNTESEYGSCPFLQLPESWEQTRFLMSTKQRSTLDYKERLIRRDFDMRAGLLRGTEIDEGVESLIRLHIRRWEEKGLPGGPSSERNHAFLRSVSSLLAGRDWLRLYGLRLDGRLQSVHYCMAYRDKEYGYVGGWEPSLGRYGLGSVLTAHAIRHAVEEGLREFDLLLGNEPYKAQWARESHTNFRLIAVKRDSRSRLAEAAFRVEQKLGFGAKLILLRAANALTLRKSA